MWSSVKALDHTQLSGILDPIAPFTKVGMHAVAAGAEICLGIEISKLSALTASNLPRIAPINSLEVADDMPQSIKQTFSGCDKKYVTSLSSLKQLVTLYADIGLINVSSSTTNSMPNVEAKAL